MFHHKNQKTLGMFSFYEQKEKKDHLNPRTLNPRKVKTRKEEWERLKMGEEFVVPKNDLM